MIFSINGEVLMFHAKWKDVLVGLIVCLGFSGNIQATQQPNVLFLFGDDHAYDAVGLMTNGYVQTPAIDELAAGGVYFERAYNMGSWSGAVCVASRTMLNAGKTLWNSKSIWVDANKSRKAKQPIKNDVVSWSQRMSDAGYDTFFAGKWHVNSYEAKQVFDHIGTVRGGMPRTSGDHHRPIKGQTDTWSPSDPKHLGFWRGGKHWSEVTADETIDYLKQRGKSKDNKPFFAYVGFNAPHDPRQSPQAYLDKYPVESVPLPGSYMPSYPYTKDIGIWPIRAETMAPRPRTEFAIKTHRREYYALISHLDAQLARIIAELDAQGLRENTVIIYTADHGLSLGNHSFMAKQSMYDHSLASPFIIQGPNIPKGVRTQQRIYIQDIVPTTLAMAGLEEAEYQDVEFENLLPFNKSGSKNYNQPIYGGYKKESRCIIKGDWKLIYYTDLKLYRLFNLKQDPHEMTDVATKLENKQRITELINILESQQHRFNDDSVQLENTL